MKVDSGVSFDGIAKAYQWMEYLSLGKLLEQTRFHYLDAGRLKGCRQALVLGDGDGRFCARLLEVERELRATAVDGSAAMLALLVRRCARARERLTPQQADVRFYQPARNSDLVVTHFLLDCLTQLEVEALVAELTPTLRPKALWLVSEFRVPSGWLRWPAWVLVRSLYLAFRILTGLRVTRLPDYAAALRANGFAVVAEERKLFGVLTTELWQLQ